MSRLSRVLFLVLFLSLIFYHIQGEGKVMTIQKGSQVSFNYTLTVDGTVVDSSQGKEPFQYTHGEGKIIPGLSRQLEGLRVGDEKSIEVSPEEAYGPVNPASFQEFSRTELPPNEKPQVGMLLQIGVKDGKTMVAKITEVKEDTIIIDLNHPLAGKTLNFQIEILSVE